MTTTTAVHLTIRGRVQGVGFRWFVHRLAAQLGVTGYVQNTFGGEVVVWGQAPREVLEELIARVRNGPPSAHVTGVETQWTSPSEEYTRFEIRD